MQFQSETSVYKFLRRIVWTEKIWCIFRNENTVFKFLRGVCGTVVIRPINLLLVVLVHEWYCKRTIGVVSGTNHWKLLQLFFHVLIPLIITFSFYCCGASVASEQQHKQDLRRIYKRENEFSKSSLFTRMLCSFLPECIAPSTRVHCATNNTRLWHCCDGVLFIAWIAVETG